MLPPPKEILQKREAEEVLSYILREIHHLERKDPEIEI